MFQIKSFLLISSERIYIQSTGEEKIRSDPLPYSSFATKPNPSVGLFTDLSKPSTYVDKFVILWFNIRTKGPGENKETCDFPSCCRAVRS